MLIVKYLLDLEIHILTAGKQKTKDNIVLCRELLGICKTETKDTLLTWQKHLLKISGVDVTKCPVCKKKEYGQGRGSASIEMQQPAVEIPI
jgi:hypothetical protein